MNDYCDVVFNAKAPAAQEEEPTHDQQNPISFFAVDSSNRPKKGLSAEAIAQLLDPDMAYATAQFVRYHPPGIRSRRVASELRDKDVSFIRAACAKVDEAARTPEFHRALLQRVLANQAAEGFPNRKYMRWIPTDHITEIVNPEPKRPVVPAYQRDYLDSPQTREERREADERALRAAIAKSWMEGAA